MSEKLQKVLARIGVGSRREMEKWIAQGRISIDGRPAQLGDRVESHHVIRIDGRPISRGKVQNVRRRVLIYHKPEGQVCTRSDPQGRPTVFERLPPLRNGRWINIGRLDINASGLLLFTTDGDLAQRLTRPRDGWEHEYAVRVLGKVDAAALQSLIAGVASDESDDGVARFDSIRDAGGQGANHWYHVTFAHGPKRDVRRLWETAGVRVSRLMHIRYGSLALPRGLRAGHWRELEKADVDALSTQLGLNAARPEKRKAAARPSRPGRAHALH